MKCQVKGCGSGQVLADRPVYILVTAVMPATVRFTRIDCHIGFLGDFDVSCHLPALVLDYASDSTGILSPFKHAATQDYPLPSVTLVEVERSSWSGYPCGGLVQTFRQRYVVSNLRSEELKRV